MLFISVSFLQKLSTKYLKSLFFSRAMVRKKERFFYDMIIRYVLLLVLAIPGLQIFYFVFQPLTTYPVYWILNTFYNVSLEASTIIVSGCYPIEIIGACVAGSAYLLFLILNLSTPNIKTVKRLKLLGIAFGSFLVLNIIRIFVLSVLLVNEFPSFDFVHSFFWYFISIVFVVGVWFYEVRKFNIKDIPFYTDIKFILKEIRKKN